MRDKYNTNIELQTELSQYKIFVSVTIDEHTISDGIMSSPFTYVEDYGISSIFNIDKSRDIPLYKIPAVVMEKLMRYVKERI